MRHPIQHHRTMSSGRAITYLYCTSKEADARHSAYCEGYAASCKPDTQLVPRRYWKDDELELYWIRGLEYGYSLA